MFDQSDQSDQRVWLVGADGTVKRTYLVSGSRFDDSNPGAFSVLSRSRYATSFDFAGLALPDVGT